MHVLNEHYTWPLIGERLRLERLTETCWATVLNSSSIVLSTFTLWVLFFFFFAFIIRL